MTRKEAIAKIRSFGKLKENWDSYGAPAWKHDDIDRGLVCLEYIWDKFEGLDFDDLFISPATDGGTGFEFKDGLFEIYINSGERV